MKHYRQGDVLIQEATGPVPEEAKPVDRDAGRVVLAYGEVTGHAHAIHDDHVTLLAISDSEVDDRFLQIVGAEAELRHEEHDTITLPPGEYVVRRQREYAPQSAPLMVAD